MTYTPPAFDQIDFELVPYEAPAFDAITFELGSGELSQFVEVDVPTGAAYGQARAPETTGGVSIDVPISTSTGHNPDPEVEIGGVVDIYVPSSTSTATAQIPSVSTSDSETISVPTAHAGSNAPVPNLHMRVEVPIPLRMAVRYAYNLWSTTGTRIDDDEKQAIKIGHMEPGRVVALEVFVDFSTASSSQGVPLQPVSIDIPWDESTEGSTLNPHEGGWVGDTRSVTFAGAYFDITELYELWEAGKDNNGVLFRWDGGSGYASGTIFKAYATYEYGEFDYAYVAVPTGTATSHAPAPEVGASVDIEAPTATSTSTVFSPEAVTTRNVSESPVTAAVNSTAVPPSINISKAVTAPHSASQAYATAPGVNAGAGADVPDVVTSTNAHAPEVIAGTGATISVPTGHASNIANAPYLYIQVEVPISLHRTVRYDSMAWASTGTTIGVVNTTLYQHALQIGEVERGRVTLEVYLKYSSASSGVVPDITPVSIDEAWDETTTGYLTQTEEWVGATLRPSFAGAYFDITELYELWESGKPDNGFLFRWDGSGRVSGLEFTALATYEHGPFDDAHVDVPTGTATSLAPTPDVYTSTEVEAPEASATATANSPDVLAVRHVSVVAPIATSQADALVPLFTGVFPDAQTDLSIGGHTSVVMVAGNAGEVEMADNTAIVLIGHNMISLYLHESATELELTIL